LEKKFFDQHLLLALELRAIPSSDGWIEDLSDMIKELELLKELVIK